MSIFAIWPGVLLGDEEADQLLGGIHVGRRLRDAESPACRVGAAAQARRPTGGNAISALPSSYQSVAARATS